ncbi:hypothetical protein P8891_05840 [Bacillus atrophaeus]|uniref:hypothetical protein n=1 Tax=Bacillus atrophaeus TaxID=1452 RepID=UPI0022828BC6|nr:hypothetical protein [Bacillus atrophaeus]MCY7947033.1 hypothetical protein [Bacillus atrophaeus]MCY8098504.1 hypothetical protein [Bacillus atrophaeus]MCY9170055.1 hypothetical protein [Bacillus atrophaeus]MEC0740609.1 hypothetical protein [Bacillus atrophaeus]MEC0746955.1 hypothetical protein [Bacillus atrophaeus]
MKYFSGSIEGKTISDFQKYDVSINNFKDRLEFVMNVLNDDEGNLHAFITTYFSNYFNSSPNQSGYLSEQDVVCKTLEGLGTYLINSKDIDSNRKVKYRFWKSKKEFQKYKESKNVNTSSLTQSMGLSEDDGVEVIDLFFNPDDKNYRMDDKQKIFKKDINEITELSTLQDGIDLVRDDSFIRSVENRIDAILPTIINKEDVMVLKKIRANVTNYVDSWAKEMELNQVLIKEAIKRPIRFRNTSFSNAKEVNGGSLDLDEVNVVKALIVNCGKIDMTKGIESEAYLLVSEFYDIIASMEDIKDEEINLIKLFQNGLDRADIEKDFGIKQYKQTRIIDRVSKKVLRDYLKKKSSF